MVKQQTISFSNNLHGKLIVLHNSYNKKHLAEINFSMFISNMLEKQINTEKKK